MPQLQKTLHMRESMTGHVIVVRESRHAIDNDVVDGGDPGGIPMGLLIIRQH